MAWRVVAIENPARLSVRDNQLVIAQEMESTLPIEDIDALILDNYGSTITTNLLTALATKGTTTVICDEKAFTRQCAFAIFTAFTSSQSFASTIVHESALKKATMATNYYQ